MRSNAIERCGRALGRTPPRHLQVQSDRAGTDYLTNHREDPPSREAYGDRLRCIPPLEDRIADRLVCPRDPLNHLYLEDAATLGDAHLGKEDGLPAGGNPGCWCLVGAQVREEGRIHPLPRCEICSDGIGQARIGLVEHRRGVEFTSHVLGRASEGALACGCSGARLMRMRRQLRAEIGSKRHCFKVAAMSASDLAGGEGEGNSTCETSPVGSTQTVASSCFSRCISSLS
jgi:hypothetical protein